MSTGRAIAYGAVTVVNALATGKGAALGIDTWVEAVVRLTSEGGVIEGRILDDPAESDVLIQHVVRRVLRHFGFERGYGAYVETRSNIPIARGLKSSSAAANAIALATLDALGESMDDLAIIRLGVEAATEAGVTVTGAFDDACASYFGGFVITDNVKKTLIRQEGVGDYKVLIHAPGQKVYTRAIDLKRIEPFKQFIEFAYREAYRGSVWTAMIMNGLLYSAALGIDPVIALDAMKSGAVAAGLSGTGPAVAAIVEEDKIDAVKQAWSRYEGMIIEASINYRKAHVLGLTHC